MNAQQDQALELERGEIIDLRSIGQGSDKIRLIVATRLRRHYAGQISGLKDDGTITGNKDHKGTLSIDQALLVLDIARSQGLNPFVHVHIWGYSGKLFVEAHYKIIAGWASVREKYTVHYEKITPDEYSRHGMAEGDLGEIAFILTASNRPHWQEVYQTNVKALLSASFQPREAFQIAARSAYEALCPWHVGIVKSDEMTYRDGNPKKLQVTGWGWPKRAQVRALRGALSISHGSPTPAEIKQFMEGSGQAHSLKALADPDYDPQLPADVQGEMASMIDAQLGNGILDDETKAVSVDLMRGPDGFEGYDDDDEDDSLEDSFKLAGQLALELTRDGDQVTFTVSENKLEQTRESNAQLLDNKIRECFSLYGKNVADRRAKELLFFMFGTETASTMTPGIVRAFLAWLLMTEKSGDDFPLNEGSVNTLKQISNALKQR